MNKGGQDARKDFLGVGDSCDCRGCSSVLVWSSDEQPDRSPLHPPDCVWNDLPFPTDHRRSGSDHRSRVLRVATTLHTMNESLLHASFGVTSSGAFSFPKNFKRAQFKCQIICLAKLRITLGISEVFLKRSVRKIWVKEFFTHY